MLGRGSAGSWLRALPACDLDKVTFSALVFSLSNGILVSGGFVT